jgi:hypothetical protein
MEAHYGSQKDHLGAMEGHLGLLDADHRTLEAHHGVLEVHHGACMLTMGPLTLTMLTWSRYGSIFHRFFLSQILLSKDIKYIPMPLSRICYGD